MIFTEYLPKQIQNYFSKCHLEPVKETLKGNYKCPKCKKTLTPETIIHIYDSKKD